MSSRCFGFVASLSVLLAMQCCLKTQAEETARYLHLLNRKSDSVAPGGVYVLNDVRAVPVVELLGSRPLNEGGGLLAFSDGPAKGRRSLGFRTSRGVDCCIRTLHCVLEVEKSEVIRIEDPFECIEIVNRPATGLAYNREAEGRIIQWRTSIASAIDRHLGAKGPPAVLCTQVEMMRQSRLVIEGFATEDEAKSFQDAILGPTGLRANWSARKSSGISRLEIPVTGEMVLSAHFRELGLVDTITVPQINFKLGSQFFERSLEPVKDHADLYFRVESFEWFGPSIGTAIRRRR